MTMTETSEASPAPDGSDHERIVRVESKVDTLIDAVNKILPGSHAEAQERTEQRLDANSEFEDRVRAEVNRGLAEQAEQQRREQAESAHKEQHELLAKMREHPPAPPSSRKTKALGWGDGRS